MATNSLGQLDGWLELITNWLQVLCKVCIQATHSVWLTALVTGWLSLWCSNDMCRVRPIAHLCTHTTQHMLLYAHLAFVPVTTIYMASNQRVGHDVLDITQHLLWEPQCKILYLLQQWCIVFVLSSW